MENTCKYCKHYSIDYYLGDYPTPVCSLYSMLEQVGNPHHDLNAIKCKDFKIKLTPFPNWNIPSEKYRWYKENEEILSKCFADFEIDAFEKYISMFCNISDIYNLNKY